MSDFATWPGGWGGVPRVLPFAPWLGVLLVPLALAALLLGLRALRERTDAHPELLRKLMHVGMGVITLLFPWLFPSPWPVVALAAGALLVLIALKRVPALRRRFGGVIHGVARESRGELYFPVAVTAVFILSRGDPVLFCLPILTLTLADSVAALIGVYYGRVRYDTPEGKKSAEGSVAFFTVAFLATHIPLLVFTRTGRVESLLIGLTFGFLVMLLEAIAWRGLDNIFIPLGGFLLLRTNLPLGVPRLAALVVVTAALFALVLVLRRARTLTDAAVGAGVLIGYVSWAAGGWVWLLPPLVLFLSYTLLWPRHKQVRDRPHDVLTVVAVASSGLVWLLLAVGLRRPELYYPYTIAFAANLCFIGITWFRDIRGRISPVRAIAASALAGWVVLFTPYLLVEGMTRPVLLAVGAALIWIAAAGGAFTILIPRAEVRNRPFPYWRQAAIGIACSSLGLLTIR